jgi:GNAT superfamily N-acetyltransferase
MTSHPSMAVTKVRLGAILDLREEYRREMDCQIVHDSWHARGFTQSYLLRVNGEIAGYGSVGGAPGDARDIAKEFFVRPPFRGMALPLFRQLLIASGARSIEAQTNDALLSLMLYDCAGDLTTGTILFADAIATKHPAPGVILRPVTHADRAGVFPHTVEPVGDWGLEYDRELVATGGILFHYNPPYGDIYMEVSAPYRQRGFGSYLVQELKRICREMERIPAARCNQANQASRRTLQRAGMFPCARIIRGRIPDDLSKERDV